MKILIVDDHVLFRQGLVSLFESRPSYQVVAEAGTVEKTIELVRKFEPDLVLMDFSLPDGTGLDATEVIMEEYPDTLVVFLTVHEDDNRMIAAIAKGAKGYMLKNTPIANLFASLDALKRGEPALSRAMTGRLLNSISKMGEPQHNQWEELEKLTPRELEVLEELAANATNREIAATLYISERTVKNHVSNILSKLGTSNRHEAANLARRLGLV
jgi:DNA-binding NarL/FixJ family response regulator